MTAKMTILSGRMRSKRKALGMTQRELSARIKMSPQYYCNIESGHGMPQPDVLLRICWELNLNYQEAVTWICQDITHKYC